MGAFTIERSYSVVASGSLVARRTGTIINVLTAVIPSPAIHTHTLEAAVSVVTRAPILAGVWHQLALIDVLRAELTCGRPRRLVKTETLNLQTADSVFWRVVFALQKRTLQTCEFWATLTVVGVYAINTSSSILALMTGTVINVAVAVFARKT